MRFLDRFVDVLHRQDRRPPQPLRSLGAVLGAPVVVGAAARGEQLGVAELAPEHLARRRRIEDLHVDALLVHVEQAALRAEAGLRGALEALHRLSTASRNPGAAIGYLPFSRVNGSPSTRKVRRPDSAAIPIFGRLRPVLLVDVPLEHVLGLHLMRIDVDDLESVPS